MTPELLIWSYYCPTGSLDCTAWEDVAGPGEEQRTAGLHDKEGRGKGGLITWRGRGEIRNVRLSQQFQTQQLFYYLVANMARGIWGQPDAPIPQADQRD